MPTTDFIFEDLPLVTAPGGFWGGLVDGIATLDFGGDGQWKVTNIRLRVTRDHWKNPYFIDPIPAVRQIVELTLLSDATWFRHAQEAVEAELDRLRNPIREPEVEVL